MLEILAVSMVYLEIYAIELHDGSTFSSKYNQR